MQIISTMGSHENFDAVAPGACSRRARPRARALLRAETRDSGSSTGGASRRRRRHWRWSRPPAAPRSSKCTGRAPAGAARARSAASCNRRSRAIRAFSSPTSGTPATVRSRSRPGRVIAAVDAGIRRDSTAVMPSAWTTRTSTANYRGLDAVARPRGAARRHRGASPRCASASMCNGSPTTNISSSTSPAARGGRRGRGRSGCSRMVPTQLLHEVIADRRLRPG